MNDEHMQLVADCEAHESKLSNWERGFIDDIKNRMEAGESLSPGTVEKLEEIRNKVTS